MLEVYTRPVTAFSQNTRVIVCQSTRAAVIVDPGGEINNIKQLIADAHCEPKLILLTHGHLDHVGIAEPLAKLFEIRMPYQLQLYIPLSLLEMTEHPWPAL